ncbi:hypothetical protein MesoLjLc_75140 [Mesorhizobium sp. L-8-10]|uniref:MliC family protein n=1 Tax=Mesorhizobium sp. L-8-10 TaxID=2744523 RepID=UPI00192672DF|nr:MliC family protein [Mesorhizobium sp. L-8-10]BCH35584.1 hypothetical protein MesoLjLc_75140 [Mesorhizobium sp. L-8-10]
MLRHLISRLAVRAVLPIALTGLAGLAIADEPGTPAVPGDRPEIISATYVCDSGNTVDVRYDNTSDEAHVATLEYKGRTFEMYNVRSASGARFATEQGLTPDKGLQWWSKGDEATMSEMLMDHTASEPTPIETCRVRQ